MPIFRYESMLLGFLAVYKNIGCSCHPADFNPDGTMDVQLVSSRDGRHWNRVGDRRTILGRGTSGEWDWGFVRIGNSLVPDGDVIRAYYSGWNVKHGWFNKCGYMPPEGKKVSIGMATWPRDRFVGLRAGSSGGEIKLNQCQPGSELHVNGDASRGSLVAEITENGTPLSGYEASTCVPLKDDALDHVIRWNGGQSVKLPKDKKVNVTIKLTNAEVFSLWWK